MARLRGSDADVGLQLAFGRLWESEDGRAVLSWILRELNVRLYTLDAGTWDQAIAQAARQLFADQLEDMIARGCRALAAEEQEP